MFYYILSYLYYIILYDYILSIPSPITKPPRKKWKLGSVSDFGKFEVRQFDFQLITFRKQFKNEATISGFHPLIIKTSQLRGVFY